MENTAKALYIAGGVLLAVIIMSLIAYFFSSISSWPQQQDDTLSTEQLAKFNAEYEVYDKSAMYGTDVISCLNKVRSNNEKYVDESGTDELDSSKKRGWFITGNKYGKEYEINAYVKIEEKIGKKGLQESLDVYFINESNNYKEELRNTNTSNKLEIVNIEQINNAQSGNRQEGVTYTEYTKDSELVTSSNYLEDNNKYIVADGGSVEYNGKKYYPLYGDNNYVLMNLIRLSNLDMKVVKKNPNKSEGKIWSKVVWTTALYDFKTRRFTCDGILYNDQTGRVNAIYFSEI